MKKSLSLLLAIAMVFTMFSGVAFAADNGSDSKAKLYDAGVLKGSLSGDTMDDATWTRQNVTVLLSRLYNVEEEAQETEKGHSFTDVTDSYYDGFITWAVEEGLFTGHSDVRFGYNEDITAQQFATVLLRALGVEFEYEDAIAAAVEAGILEEELDNDSAVLRGASYDILVATLDVEDEDGVSLGESLGLEGWVPEVPAVSAAATSVDKVTVSFDRTINTDGVSFKLQRGSSNVALSDVEWADNNRSVVLPLDTAKIMQGNYTVTVTGLATGEETATFTAENEKVTSMQFVAPSDEVAYADKVRIQFEALNQYGDATSANAGNFSAFASHPSANANVQKDSNGNLYVVVKTNGTNITQNLTQISINVINTDSQISINKVFKVGTAPYVAHVELGEVEYSNKSDNVSKNGDKAIIELIQLDQYGHRITQESGSLFDASAHVIPHLQNLDIEVKDENSDDILDVVATLTEDSKVTGEYTVSVFGGTTASTTINVKAAAYAATIELDLSATLADEDTNKYIPIIAYDREGNKLSTQDIVDNYEDGHFNITASNNIDMTTTDTGILATLATNPKGAQEVVKTGEHKGKLFVGSVSGKGMANIFISITPTDANGIVFNQNFQLTIQDKRYPVSLKVDSSNAKWAVAGAKSDLKVVAIDQYGDTIKKTIGTISETTRNVTYDVYVEQVRQTGNVVLNNTTLGAHTNLADVLDKDLEFNSAGSVPNDLYEVKISLRKLVDGTTTVIDDSVSSVTSKMEVINPDNTRLTYALKGIGDLYNAQDNVTIAAGEVISSSKHAKTVEIEAKNPANETVALPSGYVMSVAPADQNVIRSNGTDKIIGHKTGTTTVRVIHKTATNSTGNLSAEVTVKNDAVRVVEFNDGKASATMLATSTPKAYALMELKAKDNYGSEYVQVDIADYDQLLNVRYTVSDVQGTGSVSVVNNPGGYNVTTGLPVATDFAEIEITGSVSGFTLTAVAPNGETRVTAVTVN